MSEQTVGKISYKYCRLLNRNDDYGYEITNFQIFEEVQ